MALNKRSSFVQLSGLTAEFAQIEQLHFAAVVIHTIVIVDDQHVTIG